MLDSPSRALLGLDFSSFAAFLQGTGPVRSWPLVKLMHEHWALVKIIASHQTNVLVVDARGRFHSFPTHGGRPWTPNGTTSLQYVTSKLPVQLLDLSNAHRRALRNHVSRHNPHIIVLDATALPHDIRQIVDSWVCEGRAIDIATDHAGGVQCTLQGNRITAHVDGQIRGVNV